MIFTIPSYSFARNCYANKIYSGQYQENMIIKNDDSIRYYMHLDGCDNSNSTNINKYTTTTIANPCPNTEQTNSHIYFCDQNGVKICKVGLWTKGSHDEATQDLKNINF